MQRREGVERVLVTILTDPVRRSMYNTFRKAMMDRYRPIRWLWNEVQNTVVDKTTVAAVRLLIVDNVAFTRGIAAQSTATKRNPEEEKTELGVRPHH